MANETPREEQQHIDVARFAHTMVNRATIQVSEMNNARVLLNWLEAIIDGALIVKERMPEEAPPEQ